MIVLFVERIISFMSFIIQFWPYLKYKLVVVSDLGIWVLTKPFKISIAQLEVKAFICES